MTILECMAAADRSRQNQIEPFVKLKWLEKLDGQIAREVFNTHRHTAVPLPVYNEETDVTEQELLVKAPWDEMYVHWLCMRIDLELEEMELYKADGELFSTIYQRWLNDFNRTHMPRSVRALRF